MSRVVYYVGKECFITDVDSVTGFPFSTPSRMRRASVFASVMQADRSAPLALPTRERRSFAGMAKKHADYAALLISDKAR